MSREAGDVVAWLGRFKYGMMGWTFFLLKGLDYFIYGGDYFGWVVGLLFYYI